MTVDPATDPTEITPPDPSTPTRPRWRRRLRRSLAWGVPTALLVAWGIWLANGPIAGVIGVWLPWDSADGTFLFKPYLQVGDNPRATDPERAEVVWHAADRDADWWVDLRIRPEGPWSRVPGRPEGRSVNLPKVDPHRIYRVPIGGLVPGGRFAYRVGIGGTTLFEAEGKARVPAGRPSKVVIVGDIAAGTSAASAIAWRIGEARPDLVVITGDIVYSRGRISEYGRRFFPVYNADAADPAVGAPILRSTLVAAAPGNHDLLFRDLGLYPDALAYFLAWSQPLNGPIADPGSPNAPTLQGPADRRAAYLAAAGPSYPRMANFSYDSGDVHWLILDANHYVDWSDPALRSWVARDLASAPPGAWRLVAFHQPGFQSSAAHASEQSMRLLADVFEKAGVAIAFAGHVHEYQRSKPLTFRATGPAIPPYGTVEGTWTLDESYDGKATTVPKGVIYVVTGAGGAGLHDTIREARPTTWYPFTARLSSSVHSFTEMDVTADRLSLRQVAEDGRIVDAFDVTRTVPAPPR